MKIIAYPIIPPQACMVCHSQIKLTIKDLKKSHISLVKDSYKCPVCDCLQPVRFYNYECEPTKYEWPIKNDYEVLSRAMKEQKKCENKEFNK